jgi:hypothetical protein
MVMRRLAFTSVALFCCLAVSTAAFAQAKKTATSAPAKKDAAPAVAAPAPPSPELMKARMKPPVRGTASIEFIAGRPKVANGELQGVIRVKNVDNAPIVGLKIDEYFYANGKEVSACTSRVRAPIAAGEIVDVPISCPNPKEQANGNNLMFTHANGKVQPKSVKSFDAPAAAKKK